MRDLRIVVVGGGIAGLTLAAALGRNGIRCTVVERSARPDAGAGAGLQLAPNATRLLHRLSLARPLATVAVRPAAIELHRWNDDARLGGTELGPACERLYRAPYCTVHRADLYRILWRLVTGLGTAAVRTGTTVVGVDEDPAGVHLRFADGSSTVADLVIGADGIRSVVRGHLVTDVARYSGLTVYRGLIPAARVPWLRRAPRVRIWLGPGQHCVAYPVARGDVVSVVAGVRSVAAEPGESWTRPGEVADLVAAYAGWHRGVVELLAAAPSVTRWDLHERPTPRRWCTDRVALVGDAAHPMLPIGAQGANQAIEDALALATCLAGAGRDGLAAALTAYEWVRAQRLAAVRASLAGHAADHHLDDGPAQRDRDRRLAGADLAGQRWLYGYDAELAAVAALETHRLSERVAG